MDTKKLSKLKNESGIALVTALLVMVLITILGSAAIMTSTTDVNIGSNFKTYTTTFYNTDAGVATGEGWISATIGTGAPSFNFDLDGDGDGSKTDTDDGDGFYNASTGGEVNYTDGFTNDELKALAWDTTNSNTVAANQTLYIIEYLGQKTIPAAPGGALGIGGGATPPEIRYIYRITGRGISGTGRNTVQSIYATR